MHKVFKIISLLIISLSFSSCIELVEEIEINSDLSGNYHLYLEHKGLDFLFNSVNQNLNITEIKKILQKLKHQEGISNLTSNIKLNKGVFSIRFDFSDAKSLTKAIYSSFGVKKRFYHKNFLKVNQSKIVRPNLTPYIIKYVKTNGLINRLPTEKMMDYIKYRYRVISSNSIKSTRPLTNDASFNQLEYNQLYPIKSLLLKKQSTRSIIRY
ncbi:MAG: hypothetical protein PF484_05205 [Bacteroidales bacterium]|jgi:hypothetical protein|nr:hypothetical protein [Bacteroidales bacterium]